MKKMITSGQQENAVNMIASAARKGGEETINELVANGVLNAGNFQCGVIAQGDKVGAVVKAAVKTAVKTILAELAETVVGRLKRIYEDRTIELEENNGKETLAEAGDMFKAGDIFKAGLWHATKRGVCKATPKVGVAVYQMIKDGTFAQIFGGFGENLKSLCWTESQIVSFCRDRRELLGGGGTVTLFLFEGENNGFFIAKVYMNYYPGHLYGFVSPIESTSVEDAFYQYRIFVPLAEEDDNMPSMITLERKEQLMTVVASAARKVTDQVVNELAGNGVLHGDNFQRVLTQGDKIGAAVKATVKVALVELAENIVGRLEHIFADRTIELAENNGKDTLAEAGDMFKAGDIFKAGLYCATKRGVCKATPKVRIAVYQMIKDGSFSQLFGGFGENLKRLCWTESQIVAFCRDRSDLLGPGNKVTLFLFEGENGGFSVALVYMNYDTGHLYGHVYPLEGRSEWDSFYQYRIFVPQL